MAVVIVGGELTREDFEKASQDYQSYIKVTVDVNTEKVALGGEYHVDGEKLLLERGSKQTDIWGGGFNLETKEFEANALINLRPGQNDSLEILDPAIRQKFLELVASVFKNYVSR